MSGLPENGGSDQGGEDANGRRQDPTGELEAITETLAHDPCNRCVGLIKRSGQHKSLKSSGLSVAGNWGGGDDSAQDPH